MDRKLSRVSDSSRKRSLRPSISEYVRRASNFQVAQAKRKLSQKEKVLDKEIEYEESEIKGTQLAKARRLGEIILHSKIVLMLVVIINLLDCCLVLGELILDIHYIKDLLHKTEEVSGEFVHKMKEHYPNQLHDYTVNTVDLLYEKILSAECTWSNDQGHSNGHSYGVHVKRDVVNTVAHNAVETLLGNTTHSADSHAHVGHGDGHHGHSIWEDIAHGLHKASITLLAMLVFETLVKVVCMGKRFFNNKLEVFDGFIVIGSFTLDLVFIKGLTIYRIQDGILILSFLLPWRVIRVVNSLIVAIIDHEHFRLKLLYKEKKTIAAELKELKEREEKFEYILTKVENFCEGEGIPKWKIRQHTATLRKQSTITSFASLALGGMLNGFLEAAQQHKPLNKTLSEPAPHATSPRSSIPRQSSAPLTHELAYVIEEENEEEDADSESSQPFQTARDESAYEPEANGNLSHVQIIVTPVQEDTDDKSATEKDSEQKPLLQRQGSIYDNDNNNDDHLDIDADNANDDTTIV